MEEGLDLGKLTAAMALPHARVGLD